MDNITEVDFKSLGKFIGIKDFMPWSISKVNYDRDLEAVFIDLYKISDSRQGSSESESYLEYAHFPINGKSCVLRVDSKCHILPEEASFEFLPLNMTDKVSVGLSKKLHGIKGVVSVSDLNQAFSIHEPGKTASRFSNDSNDSFIMPTDVSASTPKIPAQDASIWAYLVEHRNEESIMELFGAGLTEARVRAVRGRVDWTDTDFVNELFRAYANPRALGSIKNEIPSLFAYQVPESEARAKKTRFELFKAMVLGVLRNKHQMLQVNFKLTNSNRKISTCKFDPSVIDEETKSFVDWIKPNMDRGCFRAYKNSIFKLSNTSRDVLDSLVNPAKPTETLLTALSQGTFSHDCEPLRMIEKRLEGGRYIGEAQLNNADAVIKNDIEIAYKIVQYLIEYSIKLGQSKAARMRSPISQAV